jgi:hypothetical protein
VLCSLRWDLMESLRCSPREMDSSRNDDLAGFVDLTVPYRVEKLLEGCCRLLLLNIVQMASA